jgi:hypothetical protein
MRVPVRRARNGQEGHFSGPGVPLAFQLYRLVDQHDGDIILDSVHEPAVFTDQAVIFFIQMYFTLAFWTGEYVEKFLVDCH